MKVIFSLIPSLVFVIFLSNVRAQYVVSDYSDIGDSTLDDGIFFPFTLRSAIQNANYKGVAATIEFSEDYKTIQLGTPLPGIIVPMKIKGDGLTLEPATPGGVNQGLVFEANNSGIQTTIIQNFAINGLVWNGDDGVIENVTCRNNGFANLQIYEAHRNTIGNANTSAYADNFFYGGQYGITLYRSNDNIIQRSFVGINENDSVKPNTRYGILVENSHRTIIRNNIVSGSGEHGIWIEGVESTKPNEIQSSGHLIENNGIGTDKFKNSAVPNGFAGIQITYSLSDTIRNNVVSGNLGTGIMVEMRTPGTGVLVDSRTIIEHNMIGVDRLGKKAVGNGSRGVYIAGKSNIVRYNIISGNAGMGIHVEGPNSIVTSNIVGLDSSQTVALPNGIGIGVTNDDSEYAVIGTTAPDSTGNIVAGNTGAGIYVYAAGTKNVIVHSNIIGANKDTVAFPNGGHGIHMKYSLSDILAKENLIIANGGDGIRIECNVVKFLDTTIPPLVQRPSYIRIYDNCIGCGRKNDTLARHGGSGIFILSADTISVDSNAIMGAAGNGITLKNDTAAFPIPTRGIEITQNRIGPENGSAISQIIGGDGILVDRAYDVFIGPSSYFIGSDFYEGDSNTIRFCQGHGIAMRNLTRRVTVSKNSFIDNMLGGIALDDLGAYFTNGNFNDEADLDFGSNGLQNTLNQFIGFTEGSTIYLSGTFQGKPDDTLFTTRYYSVEVYLAKVMPVGLEHRTQGSIFVKQFMIPIDKTGYYDLDTAWDEPGIDAYTAAYPFVTVTVTNPDEGTSSFSHLTPVGGGVDIAVDIDSLHSKVEPNGRVTLVALIMNRGDNPATTVTVRDTVSNVDLESVTITKGTALIVDSTFTATIPSLVLGEVVKYTAVGKVRSQGMHRRRVSAMPSETDINLANNDDTISFLITDVSSIKKPNLSVINLTIVSDRKAKIIGLGSGAFVIRVHNLLGQLVNASQVTSAGEPVEIPLEHGPQLITILRDGREVSHNMVIFNGQKTSR